MYKSGPEAWKTWDAFLGDERFRFDDEAEGFELHFRALSAAFAHQPKRWQDAFCRFRARRGRRVGDFRHRLPLLCRPVPPHSAP